MKLNQYKEKKKNKKIIIVFVAIVFLIGGIIIEKTFANFKVQKSFKVMEGNFIYEGKGDITLAFYQDNQPVEKIPTLEKGYIYERSECNNGASIEWNNSKWAPLVTNLTMSKTKCDIYFKKGSLSGSNISSNYNALAEIMRLKKSQLIYDETNDISLRFIGKNPDNYVNFNNDVYETDIYISVFLQIIIMLWDIIILLLLMNAHLIQHTIIIVKKFIQQVIQCGESLG